MISELADDEILDFLMTSDFEGDYSPDELKYLLLKWRNFYRIIHGKNERLKENYESELKMTQDKLEVEKINYIKALSEIANRDNIINSLKARKLTLKERILGKITIKEDENK